MLYTCRRSAVTRALIALLLVSVTSVPLFASGPYDEIGRILDGTDFSIAERSDIRGVFQSADTAEIPLELLVPRLQEGVSKRVGPQRIVSALQSDVERLRLARELVGDVPGGEDLLQDPSRWARALSVLQAGYSAEELQGLFRVTADHPQRFRSASALFVSLRDWGLDSFNTTRIVEAAVRSDLPPLEYPGIAEIMAAARRQRIRPHDMADRLVSALQTIDSLSTLRRRVLQ